MTAANYFARYAREPAKHLQGRLETLERERNELRSRIEIDSDITIVREAGMRAETYPITAGGEHCPIWWVRGKEALVYPIGGGTRDLTVTGANRAKRPSRCLLAPADSCRDSAREGQQP